MSSVASAARPVTVGIDVGGTKTSCVVTDADDQLLFHQIVATEPTNLAAQVSGVALSAIHRLTKSGIDSANGSDVEIAAVGVAVPGHVEPGSGSVGLAVNLGSPSVSLGAAVEARTGLPCFVEHDARAAAMWLFHRDDTTPANQNGSDLVYVSIGTGISAGIVLDGVPLRGANEMAGEFGHALAEPDGATCACGLNGCLEALAAGPAIARAARAAVAAGSITSLAADATAEDVFRAAADGDEIAREIATRVGGQLARAIRTLVLTLGVKRVVIGGGVAAAGGALLGPISDALAAERAVSPLVEAAFSQASLELLSPELEAGARGAAAIARREVISRNSADLLARAGQREGVGEI
jgi:glucokinase